MVNFQLIKVTHTHTHTHTQGIVIGHAGQTISAIATEAEEDIQTLLNTSVDLTLVVKCV